MASSSLQPYVAEFFGDCSDAVGVHLKYFLVIIFITVKKYILKSKHSFSFQFFVCIVKKSILQSKKTPPEAAASLVESGGDDIFSDDETLEDSQLHERLDRNVFAEF